MTGKIESLRPNYSGELIGKIVAEDGQYYQFNQYNLANKSKSLEEFKVGDPVQFSLFTNPKGIQYATAVKGPDDNEQTFSVSNDHGEFKQFVFVNTRRIVEALKRIALEPGFDASLDMEKMISFTYKIIANSYNHLSNDDFQFHTAEDGVESVQFPTGIKSADQCPIMLYCVKNEKENETGVPWYSEKIVCNGNFVGDTIFDLVNANWYTLTDDIRAFSETAKDVTNNDDILAAIDRCCTNRGNSLVWLKDGQTSDEENADSLYVPTGYNESSGQEIFLYCTQKKGVKGYGWYYRCATYAFAPIGIYDKGDWLMKWAALFDGKVTFTEICEDLANQTLEEKWSFEHGAPYGILKNYLRYTFAYQWTQDKVSYSQDKAYAAFNTGLPDRNTYKYLYMLFEAIPPSEVEKLHPLYCRPQYRFLGVAKAGAGGVGKILTSNIFPLPTPAQYFKSRSATVWDLDFNDNSQTGTPECDDTHILIARCDRLPMDFYKSCAFTSPRFQSIVDDRALSDAEKYKKIRQFLLPVKENKADAETTNVYRVLVASLENKISTAIRKLSWNWRAVVPCFNPERSEPCYLLPISFCDPNAPDRALIATANEFAQGCSYTIHTVVPLDWAYLDARLVCRPESEWLGTNILASEQDEI